MPIHPVPLRLVSFKEIRHDRPDDFIHYESIAVRGHELNWKIPAHRHEGLHQFQWLTQGQLQGSIDGAGVPMTAPALLMLAPGSVHAFDYSRDAVGHQLTIPSATLSEWLGGSEGLMRELATSAVLDAQALGPSATECSNAFAALATEFQQDRPGRVQALRAHATLISLLFVRCHSEFSLPARTAGTRDTLVKRFRVLLETHFRQQQRLHFYAQTLDVTVDHLSRSCRQTTGVSAQTMVHDRLLLEARRMLVYTAMPVARIADELGFTDPAYFSRFFTRALGHSPMDYRSLVAQGIRAGVSALP